MSTAPLSVPAVAPPIPGAQDRPWYIVGRWQEYEGEARANLLRLAAVAAFYAIELINYYGVDLGFIQLPKVSDLAFHKTVTAIAAAWVILGVGVHLWLRLHLLPSALKYVSTGLDVVLLTLLLMVADGPRSPLIVGYFLIPVLAGLRFQLRLVWFATVAAMLGYVWLLGWAVWIEDVRDVRVPRYHQLIFLTSLAMSGIIQGQVIRRVKSLAAEYARRLAMVDPPARGRVEPGRRELMSQADPRPKPDLTCCECGATNDPGASECWLCQRRDWRGPARFPTSPNTRAFGDVRLCVGHHRARSGHGGAWGRRDRSGLVIVLLIFVLPAWGGAEWIAYRRRRRGLPTSATRKVAWILVLTILIPILLGVALFIAVWVICMSGGPIN